MGAPSHVCDQETSTHLPLTPTTATPPSVPAPASGTAANPAPITPSTDPTISKPRPNRPRRSRCQTMKPSIIRSQPTPSGGHRIRGCNGQHPVPVHSSARRPAERPATGVQFLRLFRKAEQLPELNRGQVGPSHLAAQAARIGPSAPRLALWLGAGQSMVEIDSRVHADLRA